MQDVFRASMVLRMWHLHIVALAQNKIQLASFGVITNCVSAVQHGFASHNSNVFN